MAGDTITLTFKVAEDGSLKAISKDAEKAAASTDKAAKASNNYNKQQKGVAQAGMNGTKAFSKMNQTMGGSNGLVAAYAGLAANIFALTAGFGALSRAARATQLEQGLLAMGEASGLAMHTLSRGLVEATGNAISLEESMRSVALITSAGIDPSSIERFGQVARKAATALGRDVQDSISRLTRGVTKLEPELLDELGIMVRLDEASKTYADSIGKSVSELTNFEKRQAFLNATLEEGEKKFGALGNVDVNPYDKLAASLQNLAKSGIGTIAEMLSGLVGYLASSPTALLGVLAMFGATISQTVLGSLSEMAQTTKDLSAAQRESIADVLDTADGNNRASKTMTNFTTKMREGTVTMEDYDSVIIGQNQSIRTNISLKQRGIIETEEELAKRIKNSKNQVELASLAMQDDALAKTRDAAATAQLDFANGNLRAGFKGLWTTIKATGVTMKTAFLTTVSLKTAFNGLKVSASALGASLKTLGAGFMAMLGPLGLVFSIGTLIFDIFKGIWNFFKSDETKRFEEKTEALAEAQKELANNLAEVDSALEGSSGKINTIAGAYTALDNTLSTFIGKYEELEKATAAAGKSQAEQFNALKTFISSSKELKEGFEQQNGALVIMGETTEEFNTRAKTFLKNEKAKAAIIRNVAETAKTATDAVSKYIQAAKVDTAVDDLVSAVGDLSNSLFTSNDGKLQLRAELLVDNNAGRIIAEEITNDQALILNISAEKKALDEIQKDTENRQKKIKELTKSLDDMAWYEKGNAAHKKLTEQIQKEKTAIGANTAEQNKLAKGIAPIIQKRQEILKAEQERLIVSKNQIESAKLEDKIAKAGKANTIASINEQIDANKALQQAQLSNQQGLVNFLESEKSLLANAKKTRELTSDEAARLLDLENQITKEKKEQELLQIKLNESALREDLNREKTRLAMLNENQKVEKQILNIRKKAAAVGNEEIKNRIKLMQLEQRNANRAANLNGKLLPSQVAAIQLDDKVLKDKIAFMRLDASNKITSVMMEKELLKAKLSVLQEEIKVINAKRATAGEEEIPTGNLESLIANLESGSSVFEQQISNIKNELALSLGLMQEQINTTDMQALKDAERLAILVKQKEEVLELKDSFEGLSSELKKQADLQNQLATIRNTDVAGAPINEKKQLQLQEQIRRNGVVFAKAEMDMAFARIDAEEALLDAKFALLKAEMAKDGIDKNEAAALTALSNANAQLKNVNDQKKETMKQELAVIKARAKLESGQAAYSAGAASGIGGAIAAISASRGKGVTDPKTTAEGKNKGEEVLVTKAISGVDSSIQVAIDKLIAELQTPASNLESIDKNVQSIATKTTGGSTGGSTTPQGGSTPSMGLGKGFEKPGTRGSVYTPTDVPGKPDTGMGISKTEIDAGIAAGSAVDMSAPAVDVGAINIPKPSIGEDEKMPEMPAGANETVEQAKLSLSEARALTVGFAQDIARFGPEGEIIGQFAMGMDSMLSAVTSYKTAIQEIDAAEGSSAYNHEKRIAMADAAASGIAATQQMLAASSAHKVAAIDKEIAAERKRDGQSAASVAKIQALEKKKEATKRKAFEQNKKLQMAAVVASTASAIMTALGGPPYGLGPIFGSPIAGLAAVTGAIQLATIAKTSYDGGGTSAPSAPSKISAGSRTNSVDLAKGQNMAGELAYTRGAMGMGNMTNFRTAFTGYKHRASGGYIVGEQGPELFMPETPGTIVPADETEEMAGGAPVNVNFSIQTIDSSTMQETLQGQRANIIGMIREAAHTNGEQFLEDVDLTESDY